ncbi:MAG: HlyC/CorC family transporter [Gemmatimonadetes bacterium]|nr:HlyC/CorC family transporter [Gemmatimonadota bacterium]
MIPTLVITLLVLLNGLFVAAEFAIVGAPRASLERRAAEGDRAAQAVFRILRDPTRQDRYIATAQLGITVASLGLGMYGEHVLADWLRGHLAPLGELRWISSHVLASVFAVSILTFFHIVVGEMVPKALALQQAERAALWVTPPMLGIQFAVYPLVVVLNGMGNAVLRAFGIDRQEGSGEQYHTPEELQFVVRDSQAGGLLRKESAQVFQEIIELADLTAASVMVPRVRVTGIPLGATSAEVVEIMRDSSYTRYPIYDENLDGIVGSVHIKDLLRRLEDPAPIGAEDARPVPFVPESATVDTVLTAMREMRTQLAIVMDEHGGTAGLITTEDLFEEVVGDVEEGSGAIPRSFRGADGRLRAAGTVRLDQVGDFLGMVLEHDEVDTVSGLVLATLGRPPVIGDVVEYDEVRFEVTAVHGHGVGECVVDPLKEPANPHRAVQTL